MPSFFCRDIPTRLVVVFTIEISDFFVLGGIDTEQRLNLFGRRQIFTNQAVIDESNILEVLQDAINVHALNQSDITYLYEYYKGNQPILSRTKTIRDDILSHVVMNRANEIVTFKVGYLVGKPIQYIGRGEAANDQEISLLNDYLYRENKIAKDRELAEWFTVCGVAYRIVLPRGGQDRIPFQIDTLDPRNAFVVRYSGLGKKVLLGVYIVPEENGALRYCCYTDRLYIEVLDGVIVRAERHMLERVPIYEYPANMARLGAFEIVLSLLDTINDVETNRAEGVAQFIQSLLVMKGVDIDDDNYAKLLKQGGILCPADGDVKYITQELNQTQTQALVDDLYDGILTICGMPNRNGGSSTSDTGSAVIFRDGWQSAEAQAQTTEDYFRASEIEALDLMLYLMRLRGKGSLEVEDVDIRFTRRFYDNVATKTNVLISMLKENKIAPKVAYETCGLFYNPQLAYEQGMAYYEETLKAEQQGLLDAVNDDTDSNAALEAEEGVA